MENNVFIIIDIQEKLVNAIFNKDVVVKKAEIIAKTSKILDIPTIITEQYPKGLGQTIPEISNNINFKPIEKVSFDALKETEFNDCLKNFGTKNIILFGIETHICVYQTAKALIESGYTVTIIKDACGSRDELEYLSALENLKDLGCNIKTTEMVIFELLQTAKNPNFKEIQALIK